MFNTMIEAVGKGRDERDDEGSDELVRLRAIIAAQATALDAAQAEAAAAKAGLIAKSLEIEKLKILIALEKLVVGQVAGDPSIH